jgi:hypothetical protein
MQSDRAEKAVSVGIRAFDERRNWYYDTYRTAKVNISSSRIPPSYPLKRGWGKAHP